MGAVEVSCMLPGSLSNGPGSDCFLTCSDQQDRLFRGLPSAAHCDTPCHVVQGIEAVVVSKI